MDWDLQIRCSKIGKEKKKVQYFGYQGLPTRNFGGREKDH